MWLLIWNIVNNVSSATDYIFSSCDLLSSKINLLGYVEDKISDIVPECMQVVFDNIRAHMRGKFSSETWFFVGDPQMSGTKDSCCFSQLIAYLIFGVEIITFRYIVITVSLDYPLCITSFPSKNRNVSLIKYD